MNDQPEKSLPENSERQNAARSAALRQKIATMLVATEAILREDDEGISELALIRRLQQPPWQLLEKVDFSDPAGLYPVHFLIFHCLYRLRDDLAPDGETVDISPLRIRLRPDPTIASDGLPAEQDQLRLFYLDLSQYDLSEIVVRRMLDDFWAGRTPTRLGVEELDEAAQVLGFEQFPDDFDSVRRAYRRQAMRAHPDRGGSKEEVQPLNEAFNILRTHFLSAV
ncbi:DNA-J related domain-containing protein [Marinobacter nanhaiticus D15-8W]|uniref:Molecular chaperone DnaJ n=1 Tax=Marinobacter nanhaiticus D15-8W TaxID=626887 RepID=N6VU88_9GAMM|nr:DNA-J related domain-containing protein [Marinobacter nanhaiticus]ENO13695.1 molecular chaperone DnaJ [Marinobacter nanhaiticus D15-8W]BES71067.1 DNA-J related domain-containing protein [Marinobacter nanhaiticus D15-8W]